VTVNNGSGGDNQGYMGIELIQAPANPGTYYVKFEALSGNAIPYRIREEGDFVTDLTPAGEQVGGWALVTVVGAELLNENFQRFNTTLNMSVDRVVYVRELNLSQAADSYSIDLVLHNEDTQVDTTLQNVTLRRLGRTTTFLSDAISVVSPDPPLTGLRAVTTQGLESPLLTLGLRSLAGTLSPPSGRYTFKDRRNENGNIVLTYLRRASTRLVEILDATSNFDGVTTGDPLGGANPARDRIEAQVQWGIDGYVGVKLFNVDSAAIFTFDYWNGNPLTTDLRSMSGLPFGPAQQGSKGLQSVVPSGTPFKALVGSGQTVNPGLYRIRAHWAPNATSALSADADPFCVTDRPNNPVCDNEWIVSVGQRVFLDEASVSTPLQAYLSAVGDPRAPMTFLDAVVASVNGNFSAAGANVLVTRDPNMLRPYLTHRVRPSITPPTLCQNPGQAEIFVLGCTNKLVHFPLVDPNLDLGADVTQGINLEMIYNGPAKGPAGSSQGGPPVPPIFVNNGFAYHIPIRNANASPPWSDQNPSPATVFFNRVVNIASHEIGHGLGLMNGQIYNKHGIPPQQVSLKAIVGNLSIQGYVENPVTTELVHEPIDKTGGGFGESDDRSNQWLMQIAPFRWANQDPYYPDQYDTPTPPSTPNKWLVMDRPLHFSLSSEWIAGQFDDGTGTDFSIQQFFGERLPICIGVGGSKRSCR
jgi:hypothetical protein